MSKTFVLSDDSINSYGFRVLTQGIDLENFSKNPIMLWNHTRSMGDSDNTLLPIGRWSNIRIDDGRLLADAEFDMDDPFAKKIAKKVEKGIINACSIGIRVLEESDLAEHLLPGQIRKTVTRSMLREVSVVDIGSNANAVVLYDDEGKVVDLNADGECVVGLINNSNCKKMELNEIAMKMGLSELASEAEMTTRLEELLEKERLLKEKEIRIDELEREQELAETRRIEELVDEAIRGNRITADKRGNFVDLGKVIGSAKLKETFMCMNPAVKPSEFVSGNYVPNREKRFSEMSEADLHELRTNDAQKYAALYEKEFGFKPEINR